MTLLAPSKPNSKNEIMAKRITLTITGNIEAIKKQLQDEHGVEFSYAQVVDLLINFYRKRNKPETSWQK